MKTRGSVTQSARADTRRDKRGLSLDLFPSRRFVLLEFIVIVLAGLLTGVLCFGFLSSQANAQIREYSVGGAIAGVLVTWGALFTAYARLRGTSSQLRELVEENSRLERELLRRIPRPPDFRTEVDERHRIALAIPEGWQAQGGAIFAWSPPLPSDESLEFFPASMSVSQAPIETPVDALEYYKSLRDSFVSPSPMLHEQKTEMVMIGGETSSVPSLKMIARGYVRATVSKDPATGKRDMSWTYVPKDEFLQHVHSMIDEVLTEGEPQVKGDMSQRALHAARVEQLAPQVAHEFEVGRIRHKNQLRDLLTANTTSDDSPDPDTEDASQSPVTAEVTPTSVARAAATSIPPVATERTEVLPVDRMLVVSYHLELGKILFMDCVDDVSDFTWSAETFNKVLSSMRFLI